MGRDFWLQLTGTAPIGTLPSERITDPIAMTHTGETQQMLLNVQQKGNLHMKNPKDAAEPSMYWLSIEMGPLEPLPNLKTASETMLTIVASFALALLPYEVDTTEYEPHTKTNGAAHEGTHFHFLHSRGLHYWWLWWRWKLKKPRQIAKFWADLLLTLLLIWLR